MSKRPQKTSQLIAEIVESCLEDGTVTVEEFLVKLGNRVHTLAIFVLAIATVVAGVVPGFSTLAAVPILFIAMQMMIGRDVIWLPPSIRTKQISSRVIRGALAQSIPTLQLVEKFLRPRWSFLVGPYAVRFLAFIMVLLALILSLPIPAGNFIPSMGISILALAILERDGLLVAVSLAAVFLVSGVMIELIDKAIILAASFF